MHRDRRLGDEETRRRKVVVSDKVSEWFPAPIVRVLQCNIPKFVLDESVFLIFLFPALVVCRRQLEAQPRCHDDNPRQSRNRNSAFQEDGHEAKPFHILIAHALGAGEGKLRVLYAI